MNSKMQRTEHRLDSRGTVRDWFATEAWSERVSDLDHYLDEQGSPWGPDGRWVLSNGPDVTPLKARMYRGRALPEDEPLSEVVEGGAVSYADREGSWRRVHTGDDGLVDWSAFCFTPEYRVALAATVFEVDQAETRALRLAGTGPAALFVNGSLVLHRSGFTYMEPAEEEVDVWLPSGTSTVHVATWQVAFRECRHVLRLRVGGLPVRVVLPSPGADERVAALAEQILNAVGTPKWASVSGDVELIGPDGAALRVSWPGGSQNVRLTDGRATVSLDGIDYGVPGSASMLASGGIRLRVSLDDDKAPVFREFPVSVVPNRYRGEPVGDPAQWRDELLSHVAGLPPWYGSAVELARMQSATVRPEALERPLWMIEHRADCADFEILGLLHLWHRIPMGEWREPVQAALRGAKYWIDQPGLDAMCYFTENHQLVWHTAEMLAGEAFADEKFDNTGWTGEAHAAHGREMAREWISRRLRSGFSEFDSNAYVAIDVLALVSIVEFGADRGLAAQAAGLLDKLLFTLAANSWRGVHGSPHGRTYVPTLRSSRWEETGPIMWVCWGMGTLNEAILPATALATARKYELPTAIRAAASDARPEWLGLQRYSGQYQFTSDLLSRPFESSMVVYRTPDVMLGCVEDYRSGLPGLQEHIWGATLGPETQVYVNHAPNSATHASARPNSWAGNRILPRARQHLDTVLALYRIPDADPMGYTHAWFPLSTFDEWQRHGSWLAARRGDGYVALSTQDGLRITETGPDAWQELRAIGPGTAWVCTVGRRATDGPFADFVAALGEPVYTPTSISYASLYLDYDGPFTVDGKAVDLDMQRLHIDNPLCQVAFGDSHMTIDEYVIDLRTGRAVD